MTAAEINIAVGQQLAKRRRELGLSLARVSERCSVSLQQIHKYETGQTTISAPMLHQLSECLRVPVGYFFETLEQPASLPRAAAVGARSHAR